MHEVRLFDGEEHVETITREKARELKAADLIYFINHGKDARYLRSASDTRTEIEKFAGWNPVKQLRNSLLMRGRSGQNIANYPIPYAYPGHLEDPRAAEVNGNSGNFDLIAADSAENKAYKFRRVNLSLQNTD